MSELSRAEVHAHHPDANGKVVYDHPKNHAAREHVNMPYHRGEKGVPRRHDTVQPLSHQLETVSNVISCGFSPNPAINAVDSFILADGIGLGKTRTMASLIATLPRTR